MKKNPNVKVLVKKQEKKKLNLPRARSFGLSPFSSSGQSRETESCRNGFWICGVALWGTNVKIVPRLIDGFIKLAYLSSWQAIVFSKPFEQSCKLCKRLMSTLPIQSPGLFKASSQQFSKCFFMVAWSKFISVSSAVSCAEAC